MKKVWIPISLLCVLALCVGLWAAGHRDPQARTEAQFNADLPQLEAAAQALLAGEPAQIPPGWDGEVWGNGVCFELGGWGLGSSTSYWGVSYVPEDYPVGFQGLSLAGSPREGEGWLWREAKGDNRCYGEQLAPCWYYWNMEF